MPLGCGLSSMSAAKKPPKLIAEAFTTISQAFSSAATEAAEEIARLSRERDDALDALQTASLDRSHAVLEAESLKTALTRADMTIKHQAEVIRKLQLELNQWKEQCLRLEDTARQEAQGWKEQYLRVEREREALADELANTMDERLVKSTVPFATTTKLGVKTIDKSVVPAAEDIVMQTPTFEPARVAATDKRAVKLANGSQSFGASTIHPSPSKRIKAKAKRPSANDDDINVESSQQPFRTRIIRRVQAIVDVPVKEEEYDTDYAREYGNPMMESISYMNNDSVRRSHYNHGGELTGDADEHTSEDEDDELRINVEESNRSSHARPLEIAQRRRSIAQPQEEVHTTKARGPRPSTAVPKRKRQSEAHVSSDLPKKRK